MNVESRIHQARYKLAALSHLLSQYRGELDFSDEAAHGLAYLLEDLSAELEPILRAPHALLHFEPPEGAE